MKATVINYGVPRYFATCIGDIWLERGVEHPLDIDNPKAAEELAAFPLVDVTIIEPDKKIQVEQGKKYAKYTINQLRHMASQKGIKGMYNAAKAFIIKKLLEE